MSYESCTYVGNLMADPELRQTKSGKEVCNFVIAVNRFDGSTKKVEVSAWDALAAPAHDHLRKGREILVAGVVESGHYTDRQGNIVDTLKLTAQVVKFLGSLYCFQWNCLTSEFTCAARANQITFVAGSLFLINNHDSTHICVLLISLLLSAMRPALSSIRCLQTVLESRRAFEVKKGLCAVV